MQALNLRPEPVAPQINATEQRTSQGASRSNQDESSFEVALKKAQKELDDEKLSSEKTETAEENVTTKTTEGNKTNISQEVEEQPSVKNSETLFVKNSKTLENEELNLISEEISENLEGQTEELNLLLNQKLNSSEEVSKIDEMLKKTSKKLENKNLSLKETKEFDLSAIIQNSSNKKIKIDEEKKELLDDKLSTQELLNSILTGKTELTEKTDIQNISVLSQDVSVEVTNEFAKTESVKTEKKQPVISVIDERTVTSEGKEQGNFVTSITQTGDNSAQMSMNLAPNAQQNIQFDGIVNQAATQKTDFSSMLSSEIQNNAYEFVKAGSMVLKDNKSGTINLILHPDELGSVKIQLELSDKLIAGKIVVATKEAYEAFNSSMNALKDAFNASGFESSNFDLSWSGKESSSNQDETKNSYGFYYEKNLTEVVEDSYGMELVRDTIMYGSSLINMMA
ncbi:MAG: flagellar hook-length control protein FliK [Spirochaetaceae bacterium]|nr:flagellar hook-length control protein FliK [Spirochaetaceae bacterium]